MTVLRHALAYVDRGWPVFPIVPGTKRPATPRGFKDASQDRVRVRAWWARDPHASIGIATGGASGVLVLDVDPRNGGEEPFAELERRHGRLPETPQVHTGGSGAHFYFAAPTGCAVPCRGALGGFSGIDCKANGGYVVAPPSLHPSGRRYAWDVVFDLGVELAPCPPCLVELAHDGPRRTPTEFSWRSWNGELPRRVRLLLRDPRIRSRFERDATGLADPSPSGVEFALAALLAARGLNGEEIVHAIAASRARAGLPPRRASYLAATVGKVLPSPPTPPRRSEGQGASWPG